MHVELAHDVLARRLRDVAEARFDAIRSRADLRQVARLFAVAAYVEADTETAGLFGLLAPSLAPREFPTADTLALAESWAVKPTCDLAMLVRVLVLSELEATLHVERAVLGDPAKLDDD
jgi:hypothetical protein